MFSNAMGTERRRSGVEPLPPPQLYAEAFWREGDTKLEAGDSFLFPSVPASSPLQEGSGGWLSHLGQQLAAVRAAE